MSSNRELLAESLELLVDLGRDVGDHPEPGRVHEFEQGKVQGQIVLLLDEHCQCCAQCRASEEIDLATYMQDVSFGTEVDGDLEIVQTISVHACRPQAGGDDAEVRSWGADAYCFVDSSKLRMGQPSITRTPVHRTFEGTLTVES